MVTSEMGTLTYAATRTRGSHRALLNLALASFVTLYFELLVIRYLPVEVRSLYQSKESPTRRKFLWNWFGFGVGQTQ
jgi:hypothetical protein